MRLTPKQEAFCIAYLKTGNASEAYRQSYSASRMKPETINNKAHQLLKKGEIGARLKELNSKAVTDAVMTRQEALEKLTAVARADLSDLVEFGEHEVGEVDGQPVIQTTWRIKDSAMQDPAKMVAIAELTAGRDGLKIKTHSPLQAMQQLAKMLGWDIHELDLEAKRLANDKARKELEGGGGDQVGDVLRELIAKLPG